METYNFPPFPAKGERRLFMPSSYTPNYNLNQWEPDDRGLHTDFNADNAAIDAVPAGKLDKTEVVSFKPDKDYTTSSFGRDLYVIDWDQIDRYIYFCHFREPDESKNITLKIYADRDNSREVSNLDLTMTAFLFVLLPWHYASRTLYGFVIADRILLQAAPQSGAVFIFTRRGRQR